jgi:hypothetical protein
MRIKVGSIPACAILLVAATGVGAGAASAQAQDACLKAPSGRAPPGSHWYYHTDPATQSKCWSIKPAAGQVAPQVAPQAGRQAAQPSPAPVQEQPTRTTTAAPAGAEPQSAAPNSSPWPMPGEQPDQTDTATVAWPAPPPLPTAPDTATPESAAPESAAPVSPDQSAPPATPPAPQTPTAESAQPAASSPPQPTNPVENSPAVQSAATPAAEPVTPVASVHSRVPLAALLAGLVGLLVVGMLLRRAVIMTLGRRSGVVGRPGGIKVFRREPQLSIAAQQAPPAVLRHSPSLVPGQAETEHRVSEIEEALRHFAQRLRRRRPAPLGSFPNITRTGARARS